MAALQGILLVESVRFFWIWVGSMTPGRFFLTLLYDIALAVDMFRLWGRDWFIWAMHELRLGELCDPREACYPVSGATPWLSLFSLSALLLYSFRAGHSK